MKVIAIKNNFNDNSKGLILDANFNTIKDQNSGVFIGSGFPHNIKSYLSLTGQALHHKEEFDDEFNTQSVSSMSSSSFSSVVNKFNQYTSQMNSKKLPNTLKFILQLLISIFVLIATTSVVSLSLTMVNINSVANGIEICHHTLQRLENICSARVFAKLLMNIANGYIPTSSNIFGDRFNYYTQVLDDQIYEFRENEVYVQQQQLPTYDSLKYTTITGISELKTYYTYQMISSQAINLYIQNGYEFLASIYKYGQAALNGNSTFQKFDLPLQQYDATWSISQRLMNYLQVNARQGTYDTLLDYTSLFSQSRVNHVTTKIRLSNITTWVCISIVLLCGFVIIPLFGRIQNRILYLMQIFYTISKEGKVSMIDRIQKFKGVFERKIIAERSMDFGNKTHQDTMQSREHTIMQREKIQNNNQHLQVVFEIENAKYPIAEKQQQKVVENKKVETHSEFQSIEEDSENLQEEHQQQEKSHRISIEKSNNTLSVGGGLNSFSAKDLKKKIQKKKLNQSIVIFILICFLSSYFLLTYFLTNQTFSLLQQSFSNMELIYLRFSCGLNVIQAVQDRIINNRTILVRNNSIDSLEFFISTCTKQEESFQNEIKNNYPVYLEDVRPFFENIESGDLCESVYSIQSSVTNHKSTDINRFTLEICKTSFNGISSQGLTGIYSYVYQTAMQVKINFETYNSSQITTDYMKQTILKLSPLIDIMQTIISQPNEIFKDRAKVSIQNYFYKQSLNFVIIFVVFTIFICLTMTVFLAKNFKKLKREMLLSNNMMLMIDIEQLTDEERKAISKFLSTY